MVEIVAAVKKFFGIDECAQRWDSSRWTITRLADKGLIKTLYFGSRRLIPAAEVERIEREGLSASSRKTRMRSARAKKTPTKSSRGRSLPRVVPRASAQVEAR